MRTEFDVAFTTDPADLPPVLQVRVDDALAAVVGVTDTSRVVAALNKALGYYSSAQRPNAFLGLLPVITEHLSTEQCGQVFWQAVYSEWPSF